MHSDLRTLRQGCTFCADSTDSSDTPVGNEGKLQKSWQSLPLRPQNVLIVGAGPWKRAFINGFLKLASLFSGNKILKRLRFLDRSELPEAIDPSNLPSYLGGDSRPEVPDWVFQRLSVWQPEGAAPAAPEAAAPAPADNFTLAF